MQVEKYRITKGIFVHLGAWKMEKELENRK
jgi:hypothetical protein